MFVKGAIRNDTLEGGEQKQEWAEEEAEPLCRPMEDSLWSSWTTAKMTRL